MNTKLAKDQGGVGNGGNPGDVYTKNSGTNQDADFLPPTGGGGSGGGGSLLFSLNETAFTVPPTTTPITTASYTIPANAFAVGDVIRLTVGGSIVINATNSGNAYLNLDGNLLLNLGASAANGVENKHSVTMIGYVTATTIEFTVQHFVEIGGVPSTIEIDNVFTIAFDPTLAQTIDFIVENLTANGGLSGKFDVVAIEKIALAGSGTFTNGTTTKDAADASTVQNIAHGLGTLPSKVRIICRAVANAAVSNFLIAETVYNGATQSSQSVYGDNAGFSSFGSDNTFSLNTSGAVTGHQRGVVTFDATNIIITWTKTGVPVGTYQLLWEATI